MAQQVDRRDFIKTSVAAAAGAAMGAVPGQSSAAQTGVGGMPMGRIKNLTISRLISGGNLISGWAHARDLRYVHNLMDHYNTPEKVLETLAVLEECGVNAIIAGSRSSHPFADNRMDWVGPRSSYARPAANASLTSRARSSVAYCT